MRRDTTSLAVLVACAILGICFGCQRETKGREVLLKYISFGARTYDNITMAEFEKDHDYDISLSKDHPFSKYLLNTLAMQEAGPKFEEDIRLLVEDGSVNPKQYFYVNSHGVVMAKQGDRTRFFKVATDDLRLVHERIVALHGVCDNNPGKSPKY